MIAFLSSTLGKVALGMVGLIALGGIVLAIMSRLETAGVDKQRAADAEQTVKETDDVRRDREAAERRARDSKYCDELNRLPGPAVACP
jgi:flagellar biosynthesis/type III secretory pathway M-ring protein FliF/YscJ